MKVISKFPKSSLSGAKRANLIHADKFHNYDAAQSYDWFVGFGKDQSCMFEGTWWDMICFARNVLASENTQLVAPEFYQPELKCENYLDDGKPYEFKKESKK